MSVDALSWAFKQELTHSGLKLLLVSLAEISDPYGIGFPGRLLLARKYCNCDPTTITRNMRLLEQDRLIARVERRRENGSRTSDWVVLAPLAVDRGAMRNAPPDEYPEAVAELARSTALFLAPTSGGVLSPDESSPDVGASGQVARCGGPEPSEEPSASTPVVPERVTYKKRPVPAEDLELAELLLESFNHLTDTAYPGWTRTGQPTEALQRIVGAVMEMDGLTLTLGDAMIRQALLDPYWAPAPPQPGNIFGPGVRDRYLQAARRSPLGGGSAAGSFIDRADQRRDAA